MDSALSERSGLLQLTLHHHYYVVALVFLVFDVGVLFVLPWAVGYRAFLADESFRMVALTEILLFVGIMAVGLLYVRRRGALDRGPGREGRSR